MKNNKKSAMSGKKMVAIGAGVAAVGAGAYYLLGPNAKSHQKKAKALMAKMKKEAEAGAKKVKNLSTPLYHEAVDMVSQKYAKQYKTHEKEIKALAEKLKKDWKGTAKKAVKKAAKKAAKKAGAKKKSR